jgi:mannose-6-phosphate isomerase-like protein (cupin superfamily)
MEPRIISLHETITSQLPFDREMLYQGNHHDFNLIKAHAGFHKMPHPFHAGDSFMLVLKGSMELIVDDATYTLSEGQVAFIPKGASRGFTAGPDGFTMFAAHLKEG